MNPNLQPVHGGYHPALAGAERFAQGAVRRDQILRGVKVADNAPMLLGGGPAPMLGYQGNAPRYINGIRQAYPAFADPLMGLRVSDADQLGFMVSQTALIKREIYRQRYPDVDFSEYVPVDTEGTGWESAIQHFSQDIVGKMEPINEQTTELPLVEQTLTEHLVKVAAYGAAMQFNIQEVNQAAMVPGRNLRMEKNMALRRIHDERHWDLVMLGNAALGWNGLINSDSIVPNQDSLNNGEAGSRFWSSKTAKNIIYDINTLLEGVYTNSNTVEIADTLLLPVNVLADLASNTLTGTDTSVLKFIRENNVYTLRTGMPLMIRELRGLDKAAPGETGRAIAYSNRRDVLVYHMLLPLYILDQPQFRIFNWIIPAMTRTGGLEIKRPLAVRYLDRISATPVSQAN